MKNRFVVFLLISFVVFGFLHSAFKGEKYYIMKKESAAVACYSTTGTRLEQFCKEHTVVGVEMDKGDYILIKYR